MTESNDSAAVERAAAERKAEQERTAPPVPRTGDPKGLVTRG